MALSLVAGFPGAAGSQDVRSASHATIFEDYTPLSGNSELARRLLTPLAAAQLPSRLAAMGRGLREQAIDLPDERFYVRLPSTKPPSGYGILVFIPPSNAASLPEAWGSVLDHAGLIFVSAARSGNEESPLGRREPLAILAVHNVMTLYPVDLSRIYVSGFSGGSRIALRLALGYPDLFRGAILDAGSDAIGQAEVPLPPRDLFETFRHRSRIVYVTGALDDLHLQQAGDSMASLKRWCVAHYEQRMVSGLGHDIMPASALAQSLTALESPRAPQHPERVEQCAQSVSADVEHRLAAVRDALQAGKSSAAADDLKAVDRMFGGLAAPESVDIAGRLGLLGNEAPKTP